MNRLELYVCGQKIDSLDIDFNFSGKGLKGFNTRSIILSEKVIEIKANHYGALLKYPEDWEVVLVVQSKISAKRQIIDKK